MTLVIKAQDLQLANEYYRNGEYHKAMAYYDKISKDQKKIPAIYDNYLKCLFYVQDYDRAEQLCKKGIKVLKTNYSYKVDLGVVDYKRGNKEQAYKYFDKLIENLPDGNFYIKQTGKRFEKYDLYDYAEKAYKFGFRETSNSSFYVNLTNIYYNTGKKEKLTNHLLEGLELNLVSLNYSQNTLQRLYDVQDYDTLELTLLDKVQNQNSNEKYLNMLIWTYYQKKDFENALFQAKALDRKSKSSGKKVLEVGNVSRKNKDHKTARNAYQYLIDKYPDGSYYKEARSKLVVSKEELVKNSFPIDTPAVRSLIADYQAIIDEFGLLYSNAHVLKRMAKLHAFYLDEKDKAIELINTLTKVSGVNKELIAESKLVLGDIYVLKDEPWEAILIYGQVEKENKFSPLAHRAKFKGAKLSYYIGEFELAASHLSILKEATTKEISNDAIDLHVFIQDNSGLDTSYDALAAYAKVELMLFQNKLNEAINTLDGLLIKYPDHALVDEIYWKQSEIYLKMGKYEKAVSTLAKIQKSYADDVLADDALFQMGVITQTYLKDNDSAREYFKQILLNYSGSVFVNEARKRYRKLRGDFN